MTVLKTNEFWQGGNRVIMFSYGSGLSATMFSLKFNDGKHPFSLSNITAVMNVDKKLKSRHEVILVLSHTRFCMH